jgi:hypothetical protein
MSGWFDIDHDGLRKNSSLPKVVLEMAQNALDTNATVITINLGPTGTRGSGRLTVVDNDPVGYERLSDCYTLYAPSTKAGDDSKRGIFNLGEKEFVAFCTDGTVTSTTGRVTFLADHTRKVSKSPRTRTQSGSIHDFTLKMTRDDQAAMIARLREIILDGTQDVIVNGEHLPVRPVLMETTAVLPLWVRSDDDVYSLVERKRVVRITLHEPAAGGPTLHVHGLPVQPIDCTYSVNVHGRLKVDTARDQIRPAVLAQVLAEVANTLAEHDKLTEADIDWAGDTLGKHSTVEATRAIMETRFGPDFMVAGPDKVANAEAAAVGRTPVYGGSLKSDQWAAIKRAQADDPGFAPTTTSAFGVTVDGSLSNPISPADWTPRATEVVHWCQRIFPVLFPGCRLEVTIAGGDRAPNCIAAMGHNGHVGDLTFNQGQTGWDWFDDTEEVLDTIIHEFAHFQAGTDARHGIEWGNACSQLGARIALNGDLP